MSIEIINPKISFVSPVYQSANTLKKLVEEIELVMLKIQESYEIILVDDRSTCFDPYKTRVLF